MPKLVQMIYMHPLAAAALIKPYIMVVACACAHQPGYSTHAWCTCMWPWPSQ